MLNLNNIKLEKINDFIFEKAENWEKFIQIIFCFKKNNISNYSLRYEKIKFFNLLLIIHKIYLIININYIDYYNFIITDIFYII